MNRYAIAGVLSDMRAGRRVIVFTETQTAARAAFTAVAAHTTDGEKIRRNNGQERIQAKDGNGWVAFGRSANFRGLSADVVLYHGHWPGREAVTAEADPIVAASRGEILRP